MQRLSIEYNDYIFLPKGSDVSRCPVCGQLINKWEQNLAAIAIRRLPRLDVSTSVDGVVVVKEDVRLFLEAMFPEGIRYVSLDRGLSTIRPKKVVAFDAAARKTRFGKRCDTCGEYEWIVGATPVKLLSSVVLGDAEIARTDLEFGSNDQKNPLILLGDVVGSALASRAFSGLTVVRADKPARG